MAGGVKNTTRPSNIHYGYWRAGPVAGSAADLADAGTRGHLGLDGAGGVQGEGVGRVGEAAGLGDVVGAATEVIAGLVDEAVDRAVAGGGDARLGVAEHVVLHQELGVLPGVDGRVAHVVEEVVVRVAGAEAQAGQPRVDVLEPVVAVRYMQVPGVLAAVAVAVADQRDLEVIVDLVPGHRDVVAGVRDVHQAVVEVLAVGQVGGQVVVVDPDVRRVLLDVDRVAVVGGDLGDRQVADDHVAVIV